MSQAPRMFLVFDGAWLEVEGALAERRGGLRALAREAEGKWNLQPNLYEFIHTSGKVDSLSALQRALEGASNGVCKLEVSEHLEGKMMRSMRMEMQRLEDRVMAKVEALVTEVRQEGQWNDRRLSSSIAPIVQCLASEQIELRNKVAQLSAMAPIVQCVATEQIELRNTVAQLNVDSEKATANLSCSLKDADALERELQQECVMQAACDLDLLNTDNLEEIKEEVCHLTEKPPQADRNVSAKMTAPQGYPTTMDSKQNFGFTYSTKGLSGTTAKWSLGGDTWEVAAPFAQSNIAPRMYSNKAALAHHRSCPLLPPLY